MPDRNTILIAFSQILHQQGGIGEANLKDVLESTSDSLGCSVDDVKDAVSADLLAEAFA